MFRHPDADAFMRKYLEQPADVTARLVFADWLDETGHPPNAAWAAYIRLKAEAALHHPTSDRHAKLTREADSHALEIRANLTVPAALVVAHHRELRELLPAPNITAKLADFAIPLPVREYMPESVARENLVLPLDMQGRTLLCVTVDPDNRGTQQVLEFILNRTIIMFGARRDAVLATLDRSYGLTETESVDSILYEFPAPITFVEFAPADAESPVVRLVNLLITEAVNLRADRILLYPDLDALAVRYRIDGEWVERDRAPLRLMTPVTARFADLAGIGSHRDFHAPTELTLTGVVTMQFPPWLFQVRVTIQPSPDGPTTQIDLTREQSISL